MSGGVSHMSDRPLHLLSRYAQSIVWLARYMERIENLARVIDVTETFSRTGAAGNAWRSIVQINADEERFFARHEHADARSVSEFYVLDRENPTSIVSMVMVARENARTLRPLISTEMWSHINVFTNTVRQLRPADIGASQISSLCAMLKQQCQTHWGITEGTFYRDQGWYFYVIGKYLERGDQTSRLVDIKYHTLLPHEAVVGSAIDHSQWNAVLRAAAGYHAFRRAMPQDSFNPASVAGFLLLNNAFPRSLVLTLRQVYGALNQLRTDYGLRGSESCLERLDELRAALADQTIEEIIIRGLHEFLDWVQRELMFLHDDIANAFWRPKPMETVPAVASAQQSLAPDGSATQTMGGMTQRLEPLGGKAQTQD